MIHIPSPALLKQIKTLLIATFTVVVFTTTVEAKQVRFNKKKIDHGYQFSYQWLDYSSSAQEMTFTLSNEGLFDRFRNFRSYKSSYAQRAIISAIKKEMQRKPISGVRIYYKEEQGKYYIEAKGDDRQVLADAYQALALIESDASQKYLEDSYYQTFIDHKESSGIKVDHVRVANKSVADLKPLKPIILDHVSIQNIRKVTNYVLGFIQNIPYNTLESRINSSGAGFSPPLQVLWENQGDCDSKMTLAAALLRALMPRIDMALIYTDGHAFIGISIPGEADEVTIMHNNVSYLLGDPTGPSLMPLGTLSPETELAINQGHYTAQDYHIEQKHLDALNQQ